MEIEEVHCLSRVSGHVFVPTRLRVNRISIIRFCTIRLRIHGIFERNVQNKVGKINFYVTGSVTKYCDTIKLIVNR